MDRQKYLEVWSEGIIDRRKVNNGRWRIGSAPQISMTQFLQDMFRLGTHLNDADTQESGGFSAGLPFGQESPNLSSRGVRDRKCSRL